MQGHLVRLADELRRARQAASKKLAGVSQRQHTRHDKRAKRIEYRLGQLVYRKRIVKGSKLEQKWLGPYQILKNVSDLVYTIQMGRTEVNIHIELLKLCRASREELRERRRQNRRRMRDQEPRHQRNGEEESDDTASEEGEAWPLYWSAPRESHNMTGQECRVSGKAPGAGETETEQTAERDETSEEGNDNVSAPTTPRASESG